MQSKCLGCFSLFHEMDMGDSIYQEDCVAVSQQSSVGSESCQILKRSHRVWTSPCTRSIAMASSECATRKQRLTQLFTSDVLTGVIS